MPTEDKPYRFCLSYGYTGDFIKWAERRKIPYLSDEWKRLFKLVFKTYIDKLKEGGLDYDDFVIQTIDEAHGHQVRQVCETTPLLREADPKVKLAMTIMCSREEMERMAPHVDVWFNRNGYHWNLPFLHAEQQKGKELWSWHMSGNLKADPLTWTRSYGWRAAKHGFENISFFVWSQAAYRWQNEPIASRTVEAWRDAIEDWQTIHALEKAIAGARVRGVEAERLKQAATVVEECLKSVLGGPDNKRPFFPPNTQATADAIDAARLRILQETLAVRKLKK
jgi:hypothetical protein